MVVISHLDLPHLRLSSRDLNGALPPTCHVRVLATEALRSATLHAEGDATQLSVHYLLPLLWLTEGAAAVDWARGHAADRQGHKARDGRASSVPRAIARLKAALRAAADVTPLHASPGRFSNLSLRGRACWASFCDPCVAPYASPSHSPSQRSLDRACVASFVEVDGEVHAVIELRGDGFLHGQPERVVGAALAMANGWLHESFFEQATRGESVLDVPAAPAGRALFDGARYDFFRLQRNGVALFERPKRPTAGAEVEATAEAAAQEADVEAAAAASAAAAAAKGAAADADAEAEGAALRWRRELHQTIVRRADREAEAAWLAHLESVHAPRP